MGKNHAGGIALMFCACAASFAGGTPAHADTTVTVTASSTACQVSAPADATPPVTPSTAAGIAAEKNNNFALARANFAPLADSGNAEAERLYGFLLMQNCTGIQDKAAAATWLQKAADAGDVESQARLGNAYMNGDGVAEDDAKAIALLTKAAAANHMQAETNLGYMYLTGRGVALDRYQGMVWSVRAGEQGAPAALMNIAQAYFKGGALPQDSDKAAFYMFVALERAPIAMRNNLVATASNIARTLSVADVNRASDRAKKWSPGKDSLSDVLDDAAKRRDHPS